jgi:hypothetical protein
MRDKTWWKLSPVFSRSPKSLSSELERWLPTVRS